MGRGEDGILLQRDARIDLLEGGAGGIRAEGDGVKAACIEVIHNVGPQGDVGKPIVVRRLDGRAVAKEQDAVRVADFSAEGQVG